MRNESINRDINRLIIVRSGPKLDNDRHETQYVNDSDFLLESHKKSSICLTEHMINDTNHKKFYFSTQWNVAFDRHALYIHFQ